MTNTVDRKNTHLWKGDTKVSNVDTGMFTLVSVGWMVRHGQLRSWASQECLMKKILILT